MKYPLGLVVIVFSIYAFTDLTIKTRYTRKRLSRNKVSKESKNLNFRQD
tara:strand:+ start:365 stop:511 length:147 start_codon:yes stop_codon:yes gene_type:complete